MRHLRLFIISLALILQACGQRVTVSSRMDEEAEMFPDYRDVTVPCNIAPLNFCCLGEEDAVLLAEKDGEEFQIRSKKGLFAFSRKQWKMLTSTAGTVSLTVAVRSDNGWTALRPFTITVSSDRIDPYLSYRLIPPGYQAWNIMGIYQRNLESYRQTAVYENKLTDRNCVNCHSYPAGNPSKMVFHSREVFGGTVLIDGGDIQKLNTKTDSTVSALVYPYWHPSGKYIAFSVNKTSQDFFNHDPNRIEVYDSASDVVVFNVENKTIAWSPLTKSASSFETFPTFSPDGKWLYFCSAKAVSEMPKDYDKVKYSLCRIAFDAEIQSFGEEVDTLYSAPRGGKSVSFPRISPDGRFLVFTLHEYGNFSIWHKGADLWALDLENPDSEAFPLAEANSEDVESYHSWSRNSRWLVFSSRREDGLYTRPYITHIDENGQASKPFLLPQKNPLEYYEELMVSYNIPELTESKVRIDKAKVASALRGPGTDITIQTDNNE